MAGAAITKDCDGWRTHDNHPPRRWAGCRAHCGLRAWRRCTVLLRGLAEAADLRLRVLVGEDALDRPVDGVFTTDLLDPRRYLTGGEIVLTGLMWRRAPADSESFVAAVTAAGAVALAAGDAALGSVPGDLVTACQRHGLPLFEVPVDVSFAAITEQVLAARLGLSAGPGPAM